MEAKILDENLGKKTSQTAKDKIGENVYYSEYTAQIEKQLEDKDITYVVDNTDKSPGFKFAEAEVKGYPIRIELGARDLENGIITLVRRDTLEKIAIDNIDLISDKINELMSLYAD